MLYDANFYAKLEQEENAIAAHLTAVREGKVKTAKKEYVVDFSPLQRKLYNEAWPTLGPSDVYPDNRPW